MHGFSHQFPIAQKNAIKPNTPRDLSDWLSPALLFLFVPKSGDSFKEQTGKTDKLCLF